jgi:hypothetical protein
MKTGTIVKSSFAVSILSALIGAYMKIIHAEAAGFFLITGVIASLIFIVTAVFEVRTSKRIGVCRENLVDNSFYISQWNCRNYLHYF